MAKYALNTQNNLIKGIINKLAHLFLSFITEKFIYSKKGRNAIKQEAHGPQIAHLNNSPCIILFRKGLLWSELWINIVKLIYFKILPYIKQYIKRRNNFIFGMFLFIVILHINWDWILSSKIPICSKKKNPISLKKLNYIR